MMAEAPRVRSAAIRGALPPAGRELPLVGRFFFALLAMEVRTMKVKRLFGTILAMTLLTAGLTAGAGDADPIDAATPSQPVDVGVLFALVAEVKSLRLELLEHRLETYEQRIDLLEQGLERLAIERSEIDGQHEEIDEEVDEVELLLQDPELDGGERAYLEATREELDWKRSRTLVHAEKELDTQEHDLKARRRGLQKTRNQLAAHIQALIK